MLTSYGIVRLIEAFPKLEIAAGETWDELVAERQHVGLTLLSTDGCKFVLD